MRNFHSGSVLAADYFFHPSFLERQCRNSHRSLDVCCCGKEDFVLQVNISENFLRTAVVFIADLIEHIVVVGKNFRHFPEKGDRLIFVLVRITVT